MTVKTLVSISRIPLALLLSAGMATVAGFGCGGTDAGEFCGYGCGQPGSDLPGGGEVLMERIDLYLPGLTPAPTTYTTFHAYAFTSAQETAPLPPGGKCTPLVEGKNWPTQVFPSDAEWDDWGDGITLTRADGMTWDVPKVLPAADDDPMTPDFLTDNRPNYNRHHPFLYGGPNWQGTNFALDSWIESTEYTLSLKNKAGENMSFFTPPFHPEPYGIGNVTDPVIIPGGTADWPIDVQLVPQAPGEQHSKQKHFGFLAFGRIDVPPGAPIALYVCPEAADGSITIERSVIDSLPPEGIIQSGRLTHWMDVDEDGRRFDLVAIDCTIGWYNKEGAVTE